MEPANGDGWAELRDDGLLEGEICFLNGDDIPFIARRSEASSCQSVFERSGYRLRVKKTRQNKNLELRF